MRDLSGFFLRPRWAMQRQYEALRMFYVEGASAKEVAERHDYTVSAFNSLRRDFARRRVAAKFFRQVVRKPWSKTATKKSQLRETIVALRKRYWSIYDIARELQRQGRPLDPIAVFRLLQAEGFGKLPRRLESERRRTSARRGNGGGT